MAQADWTDFISSASSGQIRKGVSMASAFQAPEGDFVFGAHSLTDADLIAAMYVNPANFGPTPANKGGSVQAILRRYGETGPSPVEVTGFSPVIFFVDDSDISTAKGYILGLSDEATYKIVLKKGQPVDGLKAADTGVLRTSTAAITPAGQYHMLRLDLILNPHGDVVLNVFQNDLVANTPAAPVWEAVAGIDPYIDDSLGILTGSIPTYGGYYIGVGMFSSKSGRAVLIDYVRVARQLNP